MGLRTVLHIPGHLGLAKQEWTPAGRGFDTHVGYLSGSERHFSHLKGAEACKAGPDNCSGTCATVSDRPSAGRLDRIVPLSPRGARV